MKLYRRQITALMLLLCLAAQLVLSPAALAADMTAGEECIEMIRRYEGWSGSAYQSNGKWYIGYGTQIKADAYPDGITEAEAVELLRSDLKSIESTLNSFASKNKLSFTQGQFDALCDFTYIMGNAWLNGNSLLLRLIRGDVELSRRETARAFGVWCHSGGVVQPGLAARLLEEAALYLDGSADRASEFCYIAVEREEGVTYSTDFAVYERGAEYDAFPLMFRLGYTLAAMETADDLVIRIGDKVTASRFVRAVWERNTYSRSFPDVTEGSWFYDYVMELSEANVINGRSDGTYAPTLSVTTGEALKLILLAAGHSEQPTDGSHWASGYVNYAREKGYLPDAILDKPDEPITRRSVARVAALALGFGQSFKDSPFADIDDGFATALSEIGVLEGSVEDGETVFHGENPLTRSEVSAIVWRLRRARAFGTRQTLSYSSRTLTVADAPLNRYDKSLFSGSGKTMSYNDPDMTVLRGVDASRYDGDVDWAAAAKDGIDFAILRVGGRYQMSGELYDDIKFEEFYEGASAAGLRIGAYFYSQAISVREAEEEADYVLAKLEGKKIDAPVVFDWESAGSSGARTASTSVKTVCDCAVAFCEKIRAAGYTPVIYMNTYDGYIRYDLSRLTDYGIWYAGQYYGAYPKFVYDFIMWQYTDKGRLDGFSGRLDMDLWFLR